VRRHLSLAGAERPCELLPYNENCTALRVNPRAGLDSSTIELKHGVGLLERIETMLRELTDADTGRAVVVALDRPSAEHAGTRAAELPDLLVRYAPGTIPRAVVSPRLGRIESEPPPARPGNHLSGGLLIFSGEAAAGATAMEDLGPLAARALLRSTR
jgi:hypothetical protein